ncbi:MAG: hypothetical protein ACTS5I_02870 [Rhodanobacter sp.]
MTDDMDHAQALDEFDRNVAVRNTQARVAAALSPRDSRIDGLCIECEQAIEPERLAALRGCTSRCVHCAQQFEQRAKQAGGR